MSVLDGRQLLTVSGTTYTVQNPPHATAPWAQNAAFNSAMVALATTTVTVALSASTTLVPSQGEALVTFNGSTAAQTITLPSAVANPGLNYVIANKASVAVSVTSAAGNILVNQAALAPALTRVLPAYGSTTNFTSATFYSDGTNWLMLNLNTTTALT